MAATTFNKPRLITGGCLCGSVRYEAAFTDDHDFIENSQTCQCTSDRKQTGCLFFLYHCVPNDQFKLTSKEHLSEFMASERNYRGFCTHCGSFLWFRSDDTFHHSIGVGSVDPLYLFGQGAGEGNDVPEGGYGEALCNGGGGHFYCAYEVKGVTDNVPILMKGERRRIG